MKTFESLPKTGYCVRAKNPKKFREWLHRYDCNPVVEPIGTDAGGNDFYIMTGVYGYLIECWEHTPVDVLTPKQFKRLVRKAVGEPE